MKTLKNVLFILMSIISVPLALLTITGSIWYTLPMISTTKLGIYILSIFSEKAIFWTTLGSAIGFVLFYLLSKIFNKNLHCKTKNFFVHLNTWLIALVAIILSLYTFVMVEVTVTTFEFNLTRKIVLGVSFVLLFLAYTLSGKIGKITNRRIQAYENAKELNVIGRSSIIFTNILKLTEILFPQVIILVLICACLSWNVCTYFIVILAALLIPMLGNIECDLNTRADIKRKAEIKEQEFVNKVSNNIKGVM